MCLTHLLVRPSQATRRCAHVAPSSPWPSLCHPPLALGERTPQRRCGRDSRTLWLRASSALPKVVLSLVKALLPIRTPAKVHQMRCCPTSATRSSQRKMSWIVRVVLTICKAIRLSSWLRSCSRVEWSPRLHTGESLRRIPSISRGWYVHGPWEVMSLWWFVTREFCDAGARARMSGCTRRRSANQVNVASETSPGETQPSRRHR